MNEELQNLINNLDFDEYHYFYHQTDRGNGQSIIEEGLLVDGTNILDVDNILFTTAIELKPNDVESMEAFLDFLADHQFETDLRNTLEMVIMVAPKEYNKDIVEPLNEFINGNYYKGIIRQEHILGYIDLPNQTLTVNEECPFNTDGFYL